METVLNVDATPWHWRHLAIYLSAFILGIGPFFNGMFFEPVRLLGVALACGAFLLWHWDAAERRFAWTGLDLAMLAWFGTYLLASFTAVYPRGHLLSLLDLLAALAVYFLMRRQSGYERVAGGILIATGLAMVAVSVSSLAGLQLFDRFLVDLVYHGRLSGGFQYPNTFSAWLFALSFLTIVESNKPGLGPWARAAGGLFAGAFMLTLSRGGLVASPPAFLVLYLLAPKSDRLRLMVLTAVTWGPSFLLGNLSLQRLLEGHALPGLAFLLLCALPPLLTPQITRGLGALWASRRGRIWLATGIAAVLAIGLVAGQSLLHRALVQDLPMGERRSIAGFTFSDPNVVLRLSYKSDALQIMSERHFIGGGGAAWSKLYRMAQDYYYSTTQAHDHFSQTGVEAGLPGLLAFIAIWPCALCMGWKASRRGQTADGVVPAWLGAAVFIGAHSFLDFDLSYISVQLLMAMALGIVASRSASGSGPTRGSAVWTRSLAVLSVIGILLAIPLGISRSVLLIGGDLWAQGNYSRAASLYKLAIWTDPLHPGPRERLASLAQARPGLGLGDPEVPLREAVRLDPYNFVYQLRLADVALSHQRWDEAAAFTGKALQLAPMEPGVNEMVANQYWQPVASLLEMGDMTAARQRAERVIAYRDGLESRIRHAEPYRGIWTGEIGYSPLIRLRVGQALGVLGRWSEAAAQVREATTDENFQVEARQWLFLAYQQLGENAAAEGLRQTHTDAVRAFMSSESYRQLTSLNSRP